MSKKIQFEGSGFEDVENNISDDMYDILYKTRNSSHFKKAYDIFNKPFEVKYVIVGFESTLEDMIVVFTDGTNFDFVNKFIHFYDVIEVSGATKFIAISRYHSLSDNVKRTLKNCSYHPG